MTICLHSCMLRWHGGGFCFNKFLNSYKVNRLRSDLAEAMFDATLAARAFSHQDDPQAFALLSSCVPDRAVLASFLRQWVRTFIHDLCIDVEKRQAHGYLFFNRPTSNRCALQFCYHLLWTFVFPSLMTMLSLWLVSSSRRGSPVAKFGRGGRGSCCFPSFGRLETSLCKRFARRGVRGSTRLMGTTRWPRLLCGTPANRVELAQLWPWW